jgi:hypothetical protein
MEAESSEFNIDSLTVKIREEAEEVYERQMHRSNYSAAHGRQCK